MATRYETEQELRKEVERYFQCDLPEEIWQENLPREDPPFDQQHLNETIDRLREAGVKEYTPPPKQRLRSAILRSELAADSVEAEVRACREELFGNPEPPFDNFESMGEWIQAEAKKQPPAEGHAPRFGYKLDPRNVSPETLYENYKKLYKEKPGNYGIKFAFLAYPSENGWINKERVSDGTNLRRLWVVVRIIAKKLDCQEGQATGFILTGRFPVVDALSGETPGSFSPDGHNRGKIIITIREPVPEEDVIKLYRTLRKSLWGKIRTPKPLAERDLFIVRFVENQIDPEDPNWDLLRKDWNKLYPDHKFDEWRIFRKAFKRAYIKIYPNIDPLNILHLLSDKEKPPPPFQK